ncbi:MAG: glycoside hydrolase family 32 protein [Muricauda sp.]|nr:glycoside hydrolase family 32 protein [Allomuricauda sp.]
MQGKIFFGLLSVLILGCKGNDKPNEEKQDLRHSYVEQYRPQFHFTPEEKWMNDPNGLVYHEGIYHLFYQYYPEDIVWGPMHWGHATSKDLVHWEHQPIALYPDEHGLIFSGSAVVDKNNTSGFAKNGETPLVAVFTYHSMEGEKAGRMDFQTQGIAYSLDNGETWTKYDGNPVIGNSGIKDFRDPKVFWDEGSQKWVLVLVAGDNAKFYGSDNLKYWNLLSEFGREQGAHGGVWECPDLFPLQVDGSDETKWVLIISMNPGASNGGSGTQYFVGNFDGKTFISEQMEPKWLDFGTDNYAGVTYNNTPNGERIFIGWMSNWDYARDTPTQKWRSAMTVPRKLALKKREGDYLLANYPIPEVDGLATSILMEGFTVGAHQTESRRIEGLNQSSLLLTSGSKDFSITLKNKLGETVAMSMDSKKNQFALDRRNSGQVDFQEAFGNKIHIAPTHLLEGDSVEVKILVDQSSIEIFVNGGLLTMTEQLFPNAPFDTLIIENKDQKTEIEVSNVKKMESVWQ